MADFSFNMGDEQPPPNDYGQQPPQQQQYEQYGGYDQQPPPQHSGGYTPQQPPGFGASPPQQTGYGQPPAQPAYGQPMQQAASQQAPFNPNAGFGAAAQAFGGNDQMMGMAGNYAAQLAEQRVSEMKGQVDKYVDVGQLKTLFQVNTSYVGSKLRRILFPFMPGTVWQRQGKDGKMPPPKEDVNAPDLYIPVMAFVTYVLMAGLVHGIAGTFSADELGKMLSSTLGWLLLEAGLGYAALWLMNTSELGIFDIVSLCGYKYVGMVLTMIAYVLTQNSQVYYATLIWTCAALGVFMVQTIRNVNPSQPKLLPFAGVMTVLQILVMWWFTSGVVFVAPIIAGKVGKGGMGGRRGMGGGGGGGGRTRDEAIEDVEGGPDDIHDDDGGK